MNYSETLADVFVQLQAQKKIKTKKDFAELLGVSYPNLISAMNGDERYCTKNLADRALLVLDGKSAQAPARREITIPAETLELYTNLSRTAAQLAETLDRLLAAERGKKDAAG